MYKQFSIIFLILNLNGMDPQKQEEPQGSLETCAICLEGIIDGKGDVCRCKCAGHPFHSACLDRWKKNSCPTCRGRLRNEHIHTLADILAHIRDDGEFYAVSAKRKDILVEAVDFFKNEKNLALDERGLYARQKALLCLGKIFLEEKDLAKSRDLYMQLIDSSKDPYFIARGAIGLVTTIGCEKRTENSVAEKRKYLEMALEFLEKVGIERFGWECRHEMQIMLAKLNAKGLGGEQDSALAETMFREVMNYPEASIFHREKAKKGLLKILFNKKDEESSRWAVTLALDLSSSKYVDIYYSARHYMALLYARGMGAAPDVERAQKLLLGLKRDKRVPVRVKNKSIFARAQLMRDGFLPNVPSALTDLKDFMHSKCSQQEMSRARLLYAQLLPLERDAILHELVGQSEMPDNFLEQVRSESERFKRSREVACIGTQTDELQEGRVLRRRKK